MRQERLFGAHEIQRFNRDADETVAWISEKDGILSSEDYGRDLASVQTLQVCYKLIMNEKKKKLLLLVCDTNLLIFIFKLGYSCPR